MSKGLAGALVAAGLVVCMMIGQARLALHSEHLAVAHVAGVLLSTVGAVAVAGIASLCWYLTHGRWLPFRYRQTVMVTEHRPKVAALHASRDIREEGAGVWSGPAGEE